MTKIYVKRVAIFNVISKESWASEESWNICRGNWRGCGLCHSTPTQLGTAAQRMDHHPVNCSELVHEVAAAMHKHIDRSTVVLVNATLQKGQAFFDQMQQQSAIHASTLENQIAYCMTTQRQIQQENELLWQTIGTLGCQMHDMSFPSTGPLLPGFRGTDAEAEATMTAYLAVLAAQVAARATAATTFGFIDGSDNKFDSAASADNTGSGSAFGTASSSTSRQLQRQRSLLRRSRSAYLCDVPTMYPWACNLLPC